ncbi:hypothetical protein [Lactococcus lactis]
MAKTKSGKKSVYVHSYTKNSGATVKTHRRSTPILSKVRNET